MNIIVNELVAELIEKTRNHINRAEGFRTLSEKELNYRKSENTWSILECIEHLNLYGDFYNPEIKARIKKANTTPSEIFKSGILGNYFVNLMLPRKTLNKMKTFKDKNPLGSHLDKNILDRFSIQQKEYLELIEQSKNINLTKTKTSISISKLMTLRLGDTFRFITAHNERHLRQAENVLKEFAANKA